MESRFDDVAQVIDFKPVTTGGWLSASSEVGRSVCHGCGRGVPRFEAGDSGRPSYRTWCHDCYLELVAVVRHGRGRMPVDLHVIASPEATAACDVPDRPALRASLAQRRHRALMVARHAAEGLLPAPRPAERPEVLQRVS